MKEFSKEKYKVDIFKLESPVDSNQLQNSKFNKATEDAFKQLSRATKNIPNVKCTDIGHFSAYEIMKFKNIIFTETSVKELEKRYN